MSTQVGGFHLWQGISQGPTRTVCLDSCVCQNPRSHYQGKLCHLLGLASSLSIPQVSPVHATNACWGLPQTQNSAAHASSSSASIRTMPKSPCRREALQVLINCCY